MSAVETLPFGGHAKVVDKPREFHRVHSGKRIPMVVTAGTGSSALPSPASGSSGFTPISVTRRSYQSSTSGVAEFRSPLASKRTHIGPGNASVGLNPDNFPQEAPRSARRTASLSAHVNPNDGLQIRMGRKHLSSAERDRVTHGEEHKNLVSSKGVVTHGGKVHVLTHANRFVSREVLATTGSTASCSSAPADAPAVPAAAGCGKKIAATGTKNSLSDWSQSQQHRGRRTISPSPTLVGVLHPEPRPQTPSYRVTAPFATDFN